jgi:hypothetical protein
MGFVTKKFDCLIFFNVFPFLLFFMRRMWIPGSIQVQVLLPFSRQLENPGDSIQFVARVLLLSLYQQPENPGDPIHFVVQVLLLSFCRQLTGKSWRFNPFCEEHPGDPIK